MKGEMELEFVFKMLLYVVVIVVVISLLTVFRKDILTALNLCKVFPQGCQAGECKTSEVSQSVIDSSALKRYCDLCWGSTGSKNYGENCLCFILKGSYSPVEFASQNCILNCNKQASAVLFQYDNLLGKVFIKC